MYFEWKEIISPPWLIIRNSVHIFWMKEIISPPWLIIRNSVHIFWMKRGYQPTLANNQKQCILNGQAISPPWLINRNSVFWIDRGYQSICDIMVTLPVTWHSSTIVPVFSGIMLFYDKFWWIWMWSKVTSGFEDVNNRIWNCVYYPLY